VTPKRPEETSASDEPRIQVVRLAEALEFAWPRAIRVRGIRSATAGTPVSIRRDRGPCGPAGVWGHGDRPALLVLPSDTSHYTTMDDRCGIGSGIGTSQPDPYP
jgi:hypothetical protein